MRHRGLTATTTIRLPPRPAAHRKLAFRALTACLAVALGGCETLGAVSDAFVGSSAPGEGAPGHIQGFLGGVTGDEPRAVLLARETLSSGGNAADAAVALGFALSVTLPSRAGLGGGGACLVYTPSRNGPGGGAPEAIVFLPQAPQSGEPGADRPAALPMLARGLFTLHARYGKRPFETLIAPAEQLARFGVPMSRALSRDLGVVAGPLSADPGAAAVFFRNGMPLPESAQLVQGDLGATLAQLRIAGVGDLYQGVLGRKLEDAAPAAGARLPVSDLRAALPRVVAPLVVPAGEGNSAAFLPPPADGGLAAAAAFKVLLASPSAGDQAAARASYVAARWRQGGADAVSLLASNDVQPVSVPTLPASTTFATLDRDGAAVVCALTMNNLFGTGRIAPGTGMVLAASPAAVPSPLLSAALVWNPNIRAFRAAVGGSGQASAPFATAFALVEALADTHRVPVPMPTPVPDPGRANVIECNRLLPDEEGSCGWATDTRGAGLAVGSN